MKRSNKIAVGTTITILSLTMIIAYPRCDFSSNNPDSLNDSEPQVSHRIVTPPPMVEYEIYKKPPISTEQNSTQKEPASDVATKQPIAKPLLSQTTPTQPTEKEKTDTTPIPNTQR